LDRVVVAVDPPASQYGAACGIVVVGRADGRAYVLADLSVRGQSPAGWAARVADAVDRFAANGVVAESNQGGDMVRSVLESAGVRARIDMVHAQYGKAVRAEPVALLYEQGRVFHTDEFPQLEEELMSLGAEGGGPSPDRADALVWAVTDLLVDADRWLPRITLLG
jgi:phage terminase large subunit-like protein